MQINAFLPYYIFFYLLLYLFFAFVIWQAIIAYLYLGFAIGLYSACIITTFMAFLLWKKFRVQPTQETEISPNRLPFPLILIIVFGFMNYILLAIFTIKEYHPLTEFVQQQENSFLASQEMKRYANNIYNYTIEYPKAWTVYEWSDKSTTFYNNYTGTITGGTWMTITISSYNQALFDPLFTADPGVVLEVGATKDVTTKVTNMSIQGYDTVNYTFVRAANPYPQYETHFLIHHGNLMYDITFVSLTNDVANYNSDLFQRIISSFQFTR